MRSRTADMSAFVRRSSNCSCQRLGPLLADGDRGQRIDAIRGAVLESHAPARSNSTSTTARSDGASTRLDELLALIGPLSPPTSFMRAPGKATLKTRVLAVLVR